MRLTGFNFNKISIERFSDDISKLKINTKIDISKIDKFLPPNFDKELLKADFTYVLDYSLDFAKIEFKGSVIFQVEENEMVEVLDNWKKKKLEEGFQRVLFNTILRKTNVKALELEEDLGLPFHMVMPSLKKKE